MTASDIFRQYCDGVKGNVSSWQVTTVRDDYFFARGRTCEVAAMVEHHLFGSDLMLSRSVIQTEKPYSAQMAHFANSLGMHIILEGACRLDFANAHSILVESGQVWQVGGELIKMKKTYPAQSRMSSLHLEFSLEQLYRWQDEGVLSRRIFCAHHDQTPWITLQKIRTAALLSSARNVLNSIPMSGAADPLDLENNTLDLLALLLRLNLSEASSRRIQVGVDEAADIIHAEFNLPLTISDLARRVGLNECYLKRGFKEQTGETIADFIRRLRMARARDLLLDQGKTVKEAMYEVGYCHAGHFSRLFRSAYGHLPSEDKK